MKVSKITVILEIKILVKADRQSVCEDNLLKSVDFDFE